MAFETDAEKVENLPLEPVRARPYRYKRIDHRMLNADARSQPKAIASWDRQQVVVELKTGLDREAVEAGGVTEKIETEGGIVAALLGRGAK